MKNQRFTFSGSKGIRKFEFVAKTQLVSGVTISILLTDVMFVLKA